MCSSDLQGELDDTLVIYFNDNGGARAGADNGHLAKGKGSVYEGGIRVAAAMRWPGAIPAGKKSSQLMSVMDLFPTLIEAAGIERGKGKPFDGRSVWPAIQGGKAVGDRKSTRLNSSHKPISYAGFCLKKKN